MKNKLALTLALAVMALSFMGPANAEQHSLENPSSSSVQQALHLRQQGDFNGAIKLLLLQLKKNPQDLQVKLELAASYYQSGHFAPGSVLFKQLLKGKNTPANIKSNVVLFINQYKNAIANAALLDDSLQALRKGSDPLPVKITKLNTILATTPNHLASKRYLISLYLSHNRISLAKQLLDNIDLKALPPQQASKIDELNLRLQQLIRVTSQLTGKGALLVGHDNNIAGSSNNDFYDDDESYSNEKISGIYTRLSGSVGVKYAAPNIENGMVLSTREAGFQLNYFQRSFQDEVAQNRDYQIIELAAYLGKHQADNSRIRMPLSIKNITLNDENYARFFEGKLLYSWDVKGTRFTLSQKLGYRDYASFNPDRENSTLLATRLGLSHAIGDRLTFNGTISFDLLDTLNEPFRSYDRYTFAGAYSYRHSSRVQFTAGVKYQATHYKGINDLLFFNGCEDEDEADCDEPIYDYKRQDKNTSWYLQSRYQFNEHWGLKGRVSRSDRDSNQPLYRYQRNTVSVGLDVKF